MIRKYMDIVQPIDNWERNFAHMEYLWMALHTDLTLAKRIEVSYE